ncbi:hypothetical protein CC77DRAFT_1099731 [Alternaria alternata]|uniref:Rhodopsin domain-containing protein n=1 Tax=Alternaria alternata TaxID=5599 RepID=A0A177D4P2_ALTAL|nr:hypothetical protein CC77DRAFT_1099731 [Alternaria alternata]OAG14665.1 hypothetical protein CC77DRAFT_1099731 [Alternaria alternata]
MDMNQPIFSAPPGYVVDVENPQRTGEAANFWVGTLGMIFAAIFMVIRVFTKTRLAKGFTPDDSKLAQISQNTSEAFCNGIQYLTKTNSSVARSLVQYGRGTLGVHIWELTGHRVNSTMNLISVASIIYCPFLASAKLSLLFFYLRLSHIQWFRLCVYASMFVVVGYNIALVFPLIFACTPFRRNWDVTITEGSCIDRTPLYMATAVLNMATDILLLILPIPMVVKLQMPRAQKAGLICIFGVGSLTCITSAVRLALLFPMLQTIDQTWAIVMPGIWILIEANLIIITGCLPTMRLFFRHVAPRLIGESSLRSRSRKQSSTGYGGGSHHQLELKTIGSRAMNKRFEYVEDDTVSVGSEERTTAGWRGDRDSERGIVVAGNAGGITKTSSVVVESELRKSSSTDLRSSVACLR